MLSFNSISSLKAQRQLGRATDALATSSERLSSGLRINRAADDAAGLSISSSLRKDARLHAAAIRNINDGVSALNIISGTLQNQNSIITRLQELAEQSANGVYSNQQRYGLNAEYQELLREFGRIGDTTSFNSLNLLLGGRGANSSSLNIQAGISGAGNSSISFTLTDSGSLSGKIVVSNGGDLAAPVSGHAYSTDEAIGYGSGSARMKITDSTGKQRDILVVLQGDGSGSLAPQIFLRADQSNGATSTDPNYWIYSGGGSSVTYSMTTGKTTGNTTSQFAVNSLAGGATANGSIDLGGLTVEDSINVANYTNIGFTGIETVSEARNAMTILAQRFAVSSSELGKVGAAQSRLQSASVLAAVMRENAIAADSRIEDVDVAQESATYVASKIQQQVAVGVLAQANNQSTFLLDLIKGVK